MKRSRLTLKALAMLVLIGGARAVQADMSSIAVEAATKNSITINWADPSVGHRLATDVPLYTISWEPAGQYPYVALPGEANRETRTVTGSDKKPYVISGLKPDTAYNITVDAFAEKLAVFGEWINPKKRLVGAVRQRTAALEAGALLRVSATTPDSFSMELTRPKSFGFQIIRIVYKQKWSDLELNASASALELPEDPEDWSVADHRRGSHEETTDASELSLSVTFSGLLPATGYEVVAYGFNLGPNPGVKLASAMARTGGFAPLSTVAHCVAVDHRELLENYAKLFSARHAGDQVINKAATFNPDLYRIRLILGSDEGDDLSNNVSALDYLITSDKATFNAWQAEETIASFEDFIADLPPELLPVVEGEIDSDPALFQRGDSDRNGVLGVGDAIFTLKFLFHGNVKVHCQDAADSNDSGEVEIGDAVFLLNYLFSGGRDPGAPHGACGVDPTTDSQSCEEYSGCLR